MLRHHHHTYIHIPNTHNSSCILQCIRIYCLMLKILFKLPWNVSYILQHRVMSETLSKRFWVVDGRTSNYTLPVQRCNSSTFYRDLQQTLIINVCDTEKPLYFVECYFYLHNRMECSSCSPDLNYKSYNIFFSSSNCIFITLVSINSKCFPVSCFLFKHY